MRIKFMAAFFIAAALPSCDFVGKQIMKERFKDFDIDAITSEMSIMEVSGKPAEISIPELECGVEYSAPLHDLLDSIYIVPLETTPESLVGHAEKIMLCNDTLYVLDIMRGKSLKRFAMDGHFIGQIGALGNGPGEFVEPTDFHVGNDIEILDQFQGKIMRYDKQGHFISEKSLPFIALQFTRPDSLTYLFKSGSSQNYHIDGLLDYNLWTTDTSFNIKERGFFRKKGDWNPIWSFKGMYYAGSECYLTDFLTDTIFGLSPDGTLEARLVLNSNGHSTPDAYRAESNLREYNQSDYYYLFGRYSVCGDYACLNISLCTKGHDIYFSKRTGHSIIADDFLLDGDGTKFSSIIFDAATSKDNTFIFLRDSYVLYYNPNFGKYKDYIGGNFSGLKPDDNPVMVFFKMKDF